MGIHYKSFTSSFNFFKSQYKILALIFHKQFKFLAITKLFCYSEKNGTKLTYLHLIFLKFTFNLKLKWLTKGLWILHCIQIKVYNLWGVGKTQNFLSCNLFLALWHLNRLININRGLCPKLPLPKCIPWKTSPWVCFHSGHLQKTKQNTTENQKNSCQINTIHIILSSRFTLQQFPHFIFHPFFSW